jgi:hypothetical protein
MRAGRGTPGTPERSVETPVTTPSMKRLDGRKPFGPKPADGMPRTTSAALAPPLKVPFIVVKFHTRKLRHKAARPTL